MRYRVSTRKLMLAVAITAAFIASWNEWHYRIRRDRLALQEQNYLRFASEHETQATICLENHQNDLPYDYQSREHLLQSLYYISLNPEYKGWAEEAADHDLWTEFCRTNALEQARRKHEIEQHLIFP